MSATQDWSKLMRLVGHMGIFTTLLSLLGCVTIKPQPLPPQRTKAELQKVLTDGPDKIVTSKEKPLPHDADEMWVFRLLSSGAMEERYYFKGDTLIAIDLVVYETL